jgi:hypothetical protein
LLLGVPNKKLLRTRSAAQCHPACRSGGKRNGQFRGLSPYAKGARSSISAFPGEKRILQASRKRTKELKRPKVGRMARLRGTVEPIADSPRNRGGSAAAADTRRKRKALLAPTGARTSSIFGQVVPLFSGAAQEAFPRAFSPIDTLGVLTP